MPDDPTPEQLIEDALNALALGYPIDASVKEKALWMAALQTDFERRAPVMLEKLRRELFED